MKVIVAGGRDAHPALELVKTAVNESGFEITELVHGAARGIDTAAGVWAKQNGLPVRVFPADWNAHGKAAGHIRNREMAQYADALIAIWDGKSRGTENMISTAGHLGLKMHVHRYDVTERNDNAGIH